MHDVLEIARPKMRLVKLMVGMYEEIGEEIEKTLVEVLNKPRFKISHATQSMKILVGITIK